MKKRIIKKYHLKKEIKEQLTFEILNMLTFVIVPAMVILLDIIINK